MSTETLSLADFSPHVGKSFAVAWSLPQPLELTLIAATPSHRALAPGRPTSFTLLFRAPPQWTCRQDTYPVIHPERGEWPIFLVPVARDAAGTELEAIFNLD